MALARTPPAWRPDGSSKPAMMAFCSSGETCAHAQRQECIGAICKAEDQGFVVKYEECASKREMHGQFRLAQERSMDHSTCDMAPIRGCAAPPDMAIGFEAGNGCNLDLPWSVWMLVPYVGTRSALEVYESWRWLLTLKSGLVAHTPPLRPMIAAWLILPVPTRLVSTYPCQDMVGL